jgi:cytochrome c oxidase cbb3-type subunit 3
MTTASAFWILITLGIIELIALYVLGSTIQSTLKSDFFKKKMDIVIQREKGEKKKDKGLTNMSVVLSLLMFSFFSNALFGQQEIPSVVSKEWYDVSIGTIYFLLVIDLILMGLLYYFRNLLTGLLNFDKTKEELASIRQAKAINFTQILTDAVPLEEEYKVETDHEYDGIRELDNNLPPWWKFGFYVSIVAAIAYMVHYHVIKTGDLQVAEYEKTMIKESENVKAYLISQAMNVDETSVIYVQDPKAIASGKKLYMQYCKVCHLDGGQGATGPNLTDEYWIHGGNIKNIFKTIKYGAENGMKSWKDELNPIEIQQVASFIKTLTGTNPPNPKAPQGDLYTEKD